MNWEEMWSEEKHSAFLKHLETFADAKYKAFNCRLVNDDSVEYIGVRTPVLRGIAKKIACGDYKGFIRCNTGKYYEERAIQGFIISYVKVNYEELMKMLGGFIPHISSWALTDMPATKFKQILENKEVAFEAISAFTRSSNPWEARFGLILLLKIYVDETYISRILDICNSMNTTHPCCIDGDIPCYVKMGNAWLISECYIKYPAATEILLQRKTLDAWTQNKAIQKIKESFRVNETAKKRAKRYKIVMSG
ncbi:MAG: DNA alkylation repair protein [Oscillospiraceae bacterium]|nr:DNA alkylation repair protein [Oscillospiraceae bacterium]